MLKRLLVFVFVLSFALPGLAAVSLAQDEETPQFITHNGQELFLNGINLAWISFAHDLTNFDETTWVAVMDDIASAHGNTLRWWLHTDGSASPLYGEDGKVTGLNDNEIKNLKRAVDLAYERGILVMPVLWSHDMLKEKAGVPAEWNKLMIEDPEYTQAYIDNALIPMVEALKGHPGIIAWEIFNEPEGVTEEFGWTEYRTNMAYIQQFVNLLAGAIHRTDPDALVTNGSWNLRASSDIDGFTNYYRDDRLIEAGGDELGTLDFYQVHFYPEHFADDTSPFHNPASHWELDKPLVIGEFPAAGIKDLGMGYKPEGRIMRHSIDSYKNLYENGYAGALAWQWAGGDHGDLLDAKPGLNTIFNIAPEHVTVDLGDLDHIPVIEAPIDNVFVTNDTPEIAVANLADVFQDVEDGDAMTYAITQNSNPDLITPAISDSGDLSLAFMVGPTGTGNIEVTATDSGGNTVSAAFVVQVTDPNRGNVALGKPTTASTLESQAYLAEKATDGVDNTRWSTEYADDQWLMVDLENVFEISQFVLRWETAFGKSYDLQVWDGAAWQTVYSEAASDGGIDDIALAEPVNARYVRMHGIERGTEWGFSLWEFEVYGVKAEGDFAALETAPSVEAPAAEPEVVVTDSAVLFNFEDGAQGWQVATDWPQVTAVEGVDGALVMSGAWTGDGWNEGGVFVQNDEGWDLSAYDLLTVEVCAPEGAVEFFGQIFMKTGDDWAWANNPGGAPVPGDCMVYEANLADMGDMTAVKQIGVKIGTSATVFEGSFSIDNVTVLATEAPVELVPVDTVTLFDFADGAQGWQVATDWPQVTAVEGVDGALVMSGAWTGDGWNEGGVFVQNDEGWDLSAYDLLTVEVCAPEGAVEFFGQIFMKTGDDWVWANTPGGAPVPGDCTVYEAKLADMGDMTNVKQIGVKIGTSATAFEGSFSVDNVTVITLGETGTAAETAAEEETGPVRERAMLLYTFETGVDEWAIADYWAAGQTLEQSDEMSTMGGHALKLTGEFNGTEWQEMGVYIDPPAGRDWSTWDTVSVDVYVPAEAEGFLAQIFMKTGDDWAWVNTPDFQLVPGEWNTLTADLSAMGNPAAVKEIGVKIGTSTTAFSGAFYIDGVRLDGTESAEKN